MQQSIQGAGHVEVIVNGTGPWPARFSSRPGPGELGETLPCSPALPGIGPAQIQVSRQG